MTNFQKRIITSLIILPLSFFFIVIGGYYLLAFLVAVFFIANYELFSVFNKRSTILFLDLILILSLFSIYSLANPIGENKDVPFYILLWVIILVVCSDVGGYVLGKTFKWRKLTRISPNKTLSGVLGSFIFSLFSIFIINEIAPIDFSINFFDPKFFFIAIILSLIAQLGDLIISYFKRLEKIKDTGKILPGHGGILDRIDGLMFAVIFAFVLIQINIIS